LCPEAETLAAYLDHRLDAEERRVIEAHLDSCQDCYSVFVDAAAALDHVAAAKPSRRHPVRVWLPLALPLAAGLMIALFRPVWQRSSSGSNLVAELVDAAGPEVLHSTWQDVAPTRGGEGTERERVMAHRLGAYDADLEIALRTNDRPRAQETLQAAVSMLGPRGAYYEGVRKRLQAPVVPRSVADEVASGAGPREAGLNLPQWRDGRWIETARRAALARQLGFFRKEEIRDQVHEAASAAPLAAARKLEAALARIEQTEPSPADWDSLARALEDLLRGQTS